MNKSKNYSPPNKHHQIEPFLKAVPDLFVLGGGTVSKLADRFSIAPETLILLMEIARKGGAIYEN